MIRQTRMPLHRTLFQINIAMEKGRGLRFGVGIRGVVLIGAPPVGTTSLGFLRPRLVHVPDEGRVVIPFLDINRETGHVG